MYILNIIDTKNINDVTGPSKFTAIFQIDNLEMSRLISLLLIRCHVMFLVRASMQLWC